MGPTPELDARIAAVAALDQPLRRELYRLLTDAGGWTSRDEAASALGIPRTVAAFHLDKLADAGVVEVRFERTSGRSGPGAGRPSKLYRPNAAEVAASIPDRHYDLAGTLLAAAIEASTQTRTPVAACLHAVARAAGRELGAAARPSTTPGSSADDERTSVIGVLERHGYQPETGSDDGIRLANCPFHRLAEQHRDLVCGMNLDFLDGVLDGLGAGEQLSGRLEPAPGYCCVRIASA